MLLNRGFIDLCPLTFYEYQALWKVGISANFRGPLKLFTFFKKDLYEKNNIRIDVFTLLY